MIIGIGTDIVQVARIEQALEQYGKRFAEKVFTEEERRYCESRPNRAEHYAARFAAKEAFSKAIATGWNAQFQWKDVGIIRLPNGKPSLHLSGQLAQQWNNALLHISLSHTAEYAVATVLIESHESSREK